MQLAIEGISTWPYRYKRDRGFKMPLLISKGDRRRYKELLEMSKKSIQDSDSEEDGMVDYEQKRLQNILDRKNKILELKVNSNT